MAKSPDAFRTISEVSEWLDTPTHVLRFWESRFTQVKPVKRAGGRRYYRPADMLLLGGIKHLLHSDGITIRGVQKILREQGIKHVAGLSASLDDPTPTDAPAPVEDAQIIDTVAEVSSTAPETANIIPLHSQPADELPSDEAAQAKVLAPMTDSASDILGAGKTDDRATAKELEPEDLFANADDLDDNLFDEETYLDGKIDDELNAASRPAKLQDDDAEADRNFFTDTADETTTAAPDATPETNAPPAPDVPVFLTGSAKNRRDILAQAAAPKVQNDSLAPRKFELHAGVDPEKLGPIYQRLKTLRDRVAGHG